MTTNTSILVRNLPHDAQEAELKSLFEGGGFNVTSISVIRDLEQEARCLGYAYVVLDTAAAARCALSALDGVRLPGHNAFVALEAARTAPGGAVDQHHLYIGNIPPHLGDRDVRGLAEEEAREQTFSVKVVRDEAGVSRGFAFLKCESDAAARDIKDKLQKKIREQYEYPTVVFNSRKFDFDDDGYPNENAASGVLFVGNVNEEITEKDLHDAFFPFGTLLGVRRIASKHIAFMTFGDPLCARAALLHMDGFKIKSGRLQLSWGRARGPMPFEQRLSTLSELQNAADEKSFSAETVRSLTPYVLPPSGPSEEKPPLTEEELVYWLTAIAEPPES